MSLKTRQVVCIGSHAHVCTQEMPLREPSAGEMLIRVECSLISPGTELQGLRNRSAKCYNGKEIWHEFGYQNAGVVADANGCAGFADGDRVACMGAGYASHSNWSVVPQNLVWKLPDKVSFEEGAFANLLGTALWATRRAQIQFGAHAAVVGLGIVGQLIAQMSTLNGAHVIGIDRVEMRKEMALQLGAEYAADFDPENITGWKQKYTCGYGIDVGFVAFGGDASNVMTQLALVIKQSPDMHAYGKIVVVGAVQINALLPAVFGNVDICASSRTGPGYHDKSWERGGEYPEALVPWNTQRNLKECFHSIVMKKLQVTPLITHRASLDEVPAACEQLVEHPDEALAVIVQYDH